MTSTMTMTMTMASPTLHKFAFRFGDTEQKARGSFSRALMRNYRNHVVPAAHFAGSLDCDFCVRELGWHYVIVEIEGSDADAVAFRLRFPDCQPTPTEPA